MRPTWEVLGYLALFEAPSVLAAFAALLEFLTLVAFVRWRSTRTASSALRTVNIAWGTIVVCIAAFLLDFVGAVPRLLVTADLVPQGGHVVVTYLLHEYEEILGVGWIVGLAVTVPAAIVIWISRADRHNARPEERPNN